MTKMLRELRYAAGLKQEDFAAQLGVPRQTVSAIERGERMLLVLELWDYLRPLKMSVAEFVTQLDKALEK